ncbi:hypothetical protein ACO0LF_30665 [Undibacterium sp. Di27W]
MTRQLACKNLAASGLYAWRIEARVIRQVREYTKAIASLEQFCVDPIDLN